jgi:hypothetical protein
VELMGRPRKVTPTRRYHLTVEAELAERLDAYAFGLRRRPATVAARLLEDALQRPVAGDEQPADAELEALAEARRHIEELTARVAQLRSQLVERRPAPPPSSSARAEASSRTGSLGPRWEWPLAVLLTDDDWWERWLPRLYELLGRQSAHYARPRVEVLDNRGYADLMTFLFPTLGSGSRAVTWRSPAYGEAARIEDAQGGRLGLTEAGGPGSDRAVVWEPVARHVVEALCALESSGTDGTDPYMRLRAKAEITGSWVEVLRNLVGNSGPTLPGPLVG